MLAIVEVQVLASAKLQHSTDGIYVIYYGFYWFICYIYHTETQCYQGNSSDQQNRGILGIREVFVKQAYIRD